MLSYNTYDANENDKSKSKIMYIPQTSPTKHNKKVVTEYPETKLF